MEYRTEDPDIAASQDDPSIHGPRSLTNILETEEHPHRLHPVSDTSQYQKTNSVFRVLNLGHRPHETVLIMIPCHRLTVAHEAEMFIVDGALVSVQVEVHR